MNEHSYGQRVRALREERAWPQEQLAAVSGVSVRTVQRIEKGGPASFETLKALAAAFKLDVKELLDASVADKPSGRPSSVTFLIRITTGTDLFKLAGGAGAYAFEQDELDGETQVALVADFLQDLHDWGELWAEIEPGERVRTTHQFTGRIKELEDAGLWIFGMREPRNFRAGENTVPLDVLIVYVTRSTNPEIVSLDLSDHVLPTNAKQP